MEFYSLYQEHQNQHDITIRFKLFPNIHVYMPSVKLSCCSSHIETPKKDEIINSLIFILYYLILQLK